MTAILYGQLRGRAEYACSTDWRPPVAALQSRTDKKGSENDDTKGERTVSIVQIFFEERVITLPSVTQQLVHGSQVIGHIACG